MKIILQLVLIIILVLLARLGLDKFAEHAPQVPPKVVQPHVPEVEVRELVRVDRDLVVDVQGRVVVPPRLTLAPEVSGRVLAFHPELEEGARLAAGTELVRIDPVDFELALAAARAGKTTAEANVQAAEAGVVAARAAVASAEAGLSAEEVQAEVAVADWRELNEGTPPALVARTPQIEAAIGQLEAARGQVAVAEGQQAAAEAALATADVAIQQAELALARTVVTMPLDGRVVMRSVEVGQRVDPMTPLVTVQRDGWPEVRLAVPLDDLRHLGLGLDGSGVDELVAVLEASLSDRGGARQRWLARGRAVAPVLDERNPVLHLLAVTEPMPDDPDALPPTPGLFVRAQLRGLQDQSVVPVPRRAVRPDGGVLVAVPRDEGASDADGAATLEQRSILVLQHTRDEVLVRMGLEAGDLLILTPPPVVQDGMDLTTRQEGSVPVPPAAPTQDDPEPTPEG